MTFAPLLPQGRRGTEGLVVRLAAAGGEGDLPGIRMQVPCKDRPGGRQLLRRPLSRQGVMAASAVSLTRVVAALSA